MYVLCVSTQVKNGKLHYTSDAGVAGKVERNIPELYVADGRWHTLLMEKNGSLTSLSLDKTYNRDIHHVTQDFGGLNVLTLQLGGSPHGQIYQNNLNGKTSFPFLYLYFYFPLFYFDNFILCL